MAICNLSVDRLALPRRSKRSRSDETQSARSDLSPREAVMRVCSAALAISFVVKLDQPKMADRMFWLAAHVGVRLRVTRLLPRRWPGITTRDDD